MPEFHTLPYSCKALLLVKAANTATCSLIDLHKRPTSWPRVFLRLRSRSESLCLPHPNGRHTHGPNGTHMLGWLAGWLRSGGISTKWQRLSHHQFRHHLLRHQHHQNCRTRPVVVMRNQAARSGLGCTEYCRQHYPHLYHTCDRAKAAMAGAIYSTTTPWPVKLF